MAVKVVLMRTQPPGIKMFPAQAEAVQNCMQTSPKREGRELWSVELIKFTALIIGALQLIMQNQPCKQASIFSHSCQQLSSESICCRIQTCPIPGARSGECKKTF